MVRSNNLPHLQHLIAKVVDDFDGDFARRRRVKGQALGAVQRLPGVFVDVAAERLLQLIGRRQSVADQE